MKDSSASHTPPSVTIATRIVRPGRRGTATLAPASFFRIPNNRPRHSRFSSVRIPRESITGLRVSHCSTVLPGSPSSTLPLGRTATRTAQVSICLRLMSFALVIRHLFVAPRVTSSVVSTLNSLLSLVRLRSGERRCPCAPCTVSWFLTCAQHLLSRPSVPL